MLVRALVGATEVVIGVPPSYRLAEPPWPPPSSLASMIGPAKWCNRCARSSKSYREDVTAGNLAVGELWPCNRRAAPLPYLGVTDAWGPLSAGPTGQWQLESRIVHLIQGFMLFCNI